MRITAHLLCLVCLLPAVARGADELEIVSHALSDSDGKRQYTFRPGDFDGDSSDRRELPIGVFDSGIGGLTVLEAILASDAYHNETLQPGADGIPDFEGESFVYLGDQANMPYGNYAAEGKTQTLREHILKDSVFLLGRRYWPSAEAESPRYDKPPVKAIVIACNTATAYGLEDIRGAFEEWGIDVPVIGVVEAGAHGLRAVWSREQDAVAVFATVGTCASGAYPRLMQSTLGLAGYRPATITQQGSPDLAAAIEGAPEFKQQPISRIVNDDIRQLLDHHREQQMAQGSTKPIGTVMLGCTHFPLVQQEIEAAFAYWREYTNGQGEQPYATWIAKDLRYVDPASWTAKDLFRELARRRLFHPATNESGEHRFFLSVPNPTATGVELADPRSFTYQYKYGREPGRLAIEDTKIVPMEFAELPDSSQRLIRDKLPIVADALGREE